MYEKGSDEWTDALGKNTNEYLKKFFRFSKWKIVKIVILKFYFIMNKLEFLFLIKFFI